MAINSLTTIGYLLGYGHLIQGEAKGVVPEPVCANKVRNGLASADQGFSTASRQLPWSTVHPPPPISPFLLAQNLSSKQIAPTDNMQPKSDNAKWCHRWLKGLMDWASYCKPLSLTQYLYRPTLTHFQFTEVQQTSIG